MNKTAGPYGVSPRVLKACVEQLCGTLQHLFNLILSQEKVPVLWKTSCFVSEPKTFIRCNQTSTSIDFFQLRHLFDWLVLIELPKQKSHPYSHNDYRANALTSHIMKVLVRLLLCHLNKQVKTFQDLLQFANHPGVGVEDAIIFPLQRTHSHLYKFGSTVRIMFFNLSSAFNRIQPVLLFRKLQKILHNHLDY